MAPPDQATPKDGNPDATRFSQEPVKKRPPSTLPILFSVIILDLIGFGIVIPILPAYAKQFEASASTLGLLLATHAALQFLFSPLWGRLSDRIGRRPVMLITIAGTSASLLLLGLADDITGLFIARILSGLFSANISVATAYLADSTKESERTRWMGMVGASFGVGFALGPALGGFLAPYGHGLPMFVAAAMGAGNFVWAAFALKESPEHENRIVERGAFSRALSDPVTFRLCAMNSIFTLGVAQLESTFFYMMNDRFGYDVRQVAFILVAMAVLMASIQGGAMRTLAARAGERKLLLSGLFLMALAFPTLPLASGVGWLLLPLAIAAIGRAITQPPMSSMVSMRGDASDRGALLGVFQSSAALARILGPVVAGLLYDFTLGAPFYLAGALFAIGALLAMGLRDVDAPKPA